MPLPTLSNLQRLSTEIEAKIELMRITVTQMESSCLIADVPTSLRLTAWDLTRAVMLTLSILEKQATALRRAIAEAETADPEKPTP